MDVAKKYQDRLESIKDTIRESYLTFKPNYDLFNKMRWFLFYSSIRSEDETLLDSLSMPSLEFNVLPSYVSRLLGEFAKQEPSIEVGAENEETASPDTIKCVEQHIRHMLLSSDNDNVRYKLYEDLLSGGFSVAKVWTDYRNSMSMKQDLYLGRCYDPTLCGFDLSAKDAHKGDGRFCFELFPMTEKEFKETYPNIDVSKLDFTRKFEGFNWSYVSDKTKVILIADYYEKKKKRIKIGELPNGDSITMAKYEEMVQNWQDITQPPVLKNTRWTNIEIICRFRLVENLVLEYVETDYAYLPLVFFGSSIKVRNTESGNVNEINTPYIYNARDAQRLKNYSGNSLANQIENTVNHKFMVAKEALPKEQDFLDAYTDVQKANVLVYNAFFEQNPDQPIPNPIREVMKVPAPPEIAQAFTGSDSLIQNILGSYDASLGINNNQLSGTAIIEGATQSNATAMPFIVSFLAGMQRIAEIIIDLIPKYYVTPRTIPTMDEEGKKSYIKINQPGSVSMDYPENALNVKVEAGVNFQVQKSRALQQIIGLMQASQQFSQFMNEAGLPILLDNIEIRGIDQLRDMSKQWMQQQQQQKQQMMQMQQQQMLQQQQQPNPAMMKNQLDQQRLQLDSVNMQQGFQLDMAKMRQDEMKVMADLHQDRANNEVEMAKAETERFGKQVELEMAHKDMQHRHAKETVELHHNVLSDMNNNKQPMFHVEQNGGQQ